MKRTDGQSEEWREVHPCRVRGREGESEEEVKEEALCWGISSVRIPLSSRRVIDTSAASGGPEGKQPHPILLPPTLSLSIHPSIHPSLLPAPYPSVRPLHCFLSSAGSSAACPGADSDGERPPTSRTPGRRRSRRRRRRKGKEGEGVWYCPRPQSQAPPPGTDPSIHQSEPLPGYFFIFFYLFFFYQNHDIWKV